MVYSFSNSHHQGLATTFLWQLIAWCSRSYPWSAPLFYIVEKMQGYQLREVSSLHNIPYFTSHTYYNNNAKQNTWILQLSSIKITYQMCTSFFIPPIPLQGEFFISHTNIWWIPSSSPASSIPLPHIPHTRPTLTRKK